MYSAHALSDFAINVINPLYAYNSGHVTSDGTLISDLDSSWAVHDWDKEQQNFGTLILPESTSTSSDMSSENDSATVEIIAQSTLEDGTSDSVQNARIFITANPLQSSVSSQYNSDLNESKRIWLPELSDYGFSLPFSTISKTANPNYAFSDGNLLENNEDLQLNFTLDSTAYNTWKNGDQITFLFGLTDSNGSPLTIIHSPELDVDNDKCYLTTSKKFPLFALRLKNPLDISSFDLWSFRVKSQIAQRGGVTILNNVINPLKSEHVVVEVQNPSSGNVRVIVMTLDGNVVTYLSKGALSAGNHKFTWDGKNNSGNIVARGMYFVRVIGNGFDETRKVMVVK